MQEDLPGRGHYVYFSSLERTTRLALAFYLTILIWGLASLSWGTGSVRSFIGGIDGPVFYGIITLGLSFGLLSLLINRIGWLGDLHLWLDRRFFGFLEKSNDIIFQALLHVLESEDLNHVSGLGTEERYSLTKSIFSRLADNFHLFDTLMRSGIFRLWIWYWVVNYGTFTFTLLTIGCFVTMFGMFSSAHDALRPLFTFCWVAALIHLATNIILGHILTRLTRRVSESIVVSYRPEISVMLREEIARQGEPRVNTVA